MAGGLLRSLRAWRAADPMLSPQHIETATPDGAARATTTLQPSGHMTVRLEVPDRPDAAALTRDLLQAHQPRVHAALKNRQADLQGVLRLPARLVTAAARLHAAAEVLLLLAKATTAPWATERAEAQQALDAVLADPTPASAWPLLASVLIHFGRPVLLHLLLRLFGRGLARWALERLGARIARELRGG